MSEPLIEIDGFVISQSSSVKSLALTGKLSPVHDTLMDTDRTHTANSNHRTLTSPLLDEDR